MASPYEATNGEQRCHLQQARYRPQSHAAVLAHQLLRDLQRTKEEIARYVPVGIVLDRGKTAYQGGGDDRGPAGEEYG